MVNKPKAIGTAAESAVVKYIKSLGFDALSVTRKTLSGNNDLGDVWWNTHLGLVVIEVKGGATAKNASYNQIAAWFNEAEAEASNAAMQMSGWITPLLVTQRSGIGHANAGDWWVWLYSDDYLNILNAPPSDHHYMIRFRLRDIASHFA